MTHQLILGLDIGTSSVRAALYVMSGEMVPGSLVKNERSLETTSDGGSEIDAEVALKQVVETIDQVLQKPAARNGEISFVAPCAFWHSLAGVNERGKPTTKVLGWADTRSGKYTELLRKRFSEVDLHNTTGTRFHSSFWPAKLLWLRNESPSAFERTSLWLSFGDFIALRFFGIAATSVSMASGTGMLDIRSCSWDTRLVRFIGIASTSLPLVSSRAYTYRLVEKYRRRWPRLKSAEWFPAIADGAANNIGSGCLKRSRAGLMIGTSGAMRVAYEGEPPETIPSGLWCYRVDRKRVIVGGALSDGGGLFRWLTDTFRIDQDTEEILGRIPNSHGLIVLPFLSGERSTGYNETASGAIIGLKASTKPSEILQAGFESIAYRFAEIYDQINTVVRVREIIASGGAIESSPAWAQILANVLGRDLTLTDSKEASMRGAVLLALETLGKIEKLEKTPVPTGKRFSADKTGKAAYALARRRHQKAYALLIDRQNT